MSLATAATYRNEFKNKLLQYTSINDKHLQSSNVYAKVISLLQYIRPMMMAQDWAESSRVLINYGNFINQFLSDTIKSMQQLKRTYTKMYRQKMSILFNEYIYIYTHTHTHTQQNSSTRSRWDTRSIFNLFEFSFPSPRLVAILSLKRSVWPTIYP